MLMKQIARKEDKERILSLAEGKTYIDVNSDNYDVFVIESNRENIFFLFYVGKHSGIALLERYDLNNNTAAYFGKNYFLNEDFSNLIEDMGCEDFLQLNPVQQCEVVYALLEEERKAELKSFKKDMEKLFENIFPMPTDINSIDDIYEYEEAKKEFIQSKRSTKATRPIIA